MFFFINISTSASNKIGFQVFLLFALTQHTRDRKFLETIKDYLDCGAVKDSNSRINLLTLKVVKFTDIFEKIVPFFNKYKVLGVKSSDFNF
ncbi:MAG: LAGLIDADG family homing endonuclease [Rickettsia endosymbiont of Ixodes persulcatus]|nr:LAGLIDADG family homing endonuclease [Rickettsia endosymbiont of Ixodes persulcatus]